MHHIPFPGHLDRVHECLPHLVKFLPHRVVELNAPTWLLPHGIILALHHQCCIINIQLFLGVGAWVMVNVRVRQVAMARVMARVIQSKNAHIYNARILVILYI